MIKWTFNKIALIFLHLATWVLLHVSIIRCFNYMIPYCEDVASMVGVWALCVVVNYYTAKFMTRQACNIYVGLYSNGGHS
jgi:hypothetical protein